MDKKQKIQNAYIEYVLENGSKPASVFTFMKKLKLQEREFYEYFNSFELLESGIWKSIIENTIEKIQSEEVYNTQYSVREKLLGFYYTLIEELKNNRSFVGHSLGSQKMSPFKTSPMLSDFKSVFVEYIKNLMAEGQESREVQSRRFVSERYPEIFWLQLIFVLDFWIKDPSQNFEKTDTLIEKAVNTSFDLIGNTVLDTMIDFGKFVFQNQAVLRKSS
jgi:hypothetical protein